MKLINATIITMIIHKLFFITPLRRAVLCLLDAPSHSAVILPSFHNLVSFCFTH